MGFLSRHRTRIYYPETIFEELEQRIVLDASVDSTLQDHPIGGSDTHGITPELLAKLCPCRFLSMAVPPRAEVWG